MVASTPAPQRDPLHTLLDRLSADTPLLSDVRKAAAVLPPAGRVDFPLTTDEVAAHFETWRRDGGMNGLELLFALAPDQSDTCRMAAVLASVPSALSFHNQHHTREVVYLAMLLADGFDVQAKVEIFIAACIHDFAHDGRGNRRGAHHTPMRLERRALDCAAPYLLAAGLAEQAWQRIRVMVLATDVSKDGADAISPAEWLRRALKKESSEGCPAELRPLFLDADLALRAAILEDADLGTSAGMPYNHASMMTALIADETGVLAPTPQTLIGFLDHICHGTFLTHRALEVFGDSITGLKLRAQDETADTIYAWS